MEEFASAREQFPLIVDRLQSAAALGMEHGEVEGSRYPSDVRINELGEGLSSNMTILSEGGVGFRAAR